MERLRDTENKLMVTLKGKGERDKLEEFRITIHTLVYKNRQAKSTRTQEAYSTRDPTRYSA